VARRNVFAAARQRGRRQTADATQKCALIEHQRRGTSTGCGNMLGAHRVAGIAVANSNNGMDNGGGGNTRLSSAAFCLSCGARHLFTLKTRLNLSPPARGVQHTAPLVAVLDLQQPAARTAYASPPARIARKTSPRHAIGAVALPRTWRFNLYRSAPALPARPLSAANSTPLNGRTTHQPAVSVGAHCGRRAHGDDISVGSSMAPLWRRQAKAHHPASLCTLGL